MEPPNTDCSQEADPINGGKAQQQQQQSVQSAKPPIITKIESVAAFSELLKKNQGLIFVKFGAAWCGPCKRIEPLVNQWFSRMPDRVQCCLIDVDQNIELYSFLKNKRQINGIPAIMCYDKRNYNYIPTDMTAGADEKQTNAFFMRCMQRLDRIR